MKSEEKDLRYARLVSDITNPLYVALPTFLMIALSTIGDIGHALLCWLITTMAVSVAPLTFVLQGVRKGRYTDHHLSIRQHRLIPLLFALTCNLFAVMLLLWLHTSWELLATMIAVLVSNLIALLITRRWKISLHLIGAAGAVTVLTLVCSPWYALLSPLVVLVAWARWKVGAHTPAQALVGALMAIGVTICTFLLFRIAR